MLTPPPKKNDNKKRRSREQSTTVSLLNNKKPPQSQLHAHEVLDEEEVSAYLPPELFGDEDDQSQEEEQVYDDEEDKDKEDEEIDENSERLEPDALIHLLHDVYGRPPELSNDLLSYREPNDSEEEDRDQSIDEEEEEEEDILLNKEYCRLEVLFKTETLVISKYSDAAFHYCLVKLPKDIFNKLLRFESFETPLLIVLRKIDSGNLLSELEWSVLGVRLEGKGWNNYTHYPRERNVLMMKREKPELQCLISVNDCLPAPSAPSAPPALPMISCSGDGSGNDSSGLSVDDSSEDSSARSRTSRLTSRLASLSTCNSSSVPLTSSQPQASKDFNYAISEESSNDSDSFIKRIEATSLTTQPSSALPRLMESPTVRCIPSPRQGEPTGYSSSLTGSSNMRPAPNSHEPPKKTSSFRARANSSITRPPGASASTTPLIRSSTRTSMTKKQYEGSVRQQNSQRILVSPRGRGITPSLLLQYTPTSSLFSPLQNSQLPLNFLSPSPSSSPSPSPSPPASPSSSITMSFPPQPIMFPKLKGQKSSFTPTESRKFQKSVSRSTPPPKLVGFKPQNRSETLEETRAKVAQTFDTSTDLEDEQEEYIHDDDDEVDESEEEARDDEYERDDDKLRKSPLECHGMDSSDSGALNSTHFPSAPLLSPCPANSSRLTISWTYSSSSSSSPSPSSCYESTQVMAASSSHHSSHHIRMTRSSSSPSPRKKGKKGEDPNTRLPSTSKSSCLLIPLPDSGPQPSPRSPCSSPPYSPSLSSHSTTTSTSSLSSHSTSSLSSFPSSSSLSSQSSFPSLTSLTSLPSLPSLPLIGSFHTLPPVPSRTSAIFKNEPPFPSTAQPLGSPNQNRPRSVSKRHISFSPVPSNLESPTKVTAPRSTSSKQLHHITTLDIETQYDNPSTSE